METGPQPNNPSLEKIISTHRDFELRLTERGKPAVDSALKYLSEKQNLNFPEDTKYGYLQLIYGDGHNNNNLVVTNPESGNPEYVIKIFKTDHKDPSRYDREQKALSLLKNSGQFPEDPNNPVNIPQTVHHDDEHQYTIQRYVEGTRPLDMTITKDHIKLMVEFVSRVNSITPSKENKEILPFPTTDQVPTPYCVYLDYLKRMQDFSDYFNSNTKWHKTFLDKMEEWDIKNRITVVEQKILDHIGHVQLHTFTPEKDLRINQNDTSFFNTKETGNSEEDPQLCVFDFEFAGWDSPFDMVTNFVHHVQNQDISQELKQQFVDEYVDKMQLTSEQITDLNARLALAYLEWISITLRSTIPERLRKFPKHEYMSRNQQRIDNFLTNIHKKLDQDPFAIQAKHPIT